MFQRTFDGGSIIRIEAGESVLDVLTAYCDEQGIAAGAFTGLGAVSRARLGYYDDENKAYVEREFTTNLEVLALNGNISRKADGTLFAHCHCVLSGSDMQTVGGHLFEGIANPTLEIILWVFDGELRRIPVPGSSAQVLDL